jgi:hypothetical protein
MKIGDRVRIIGNRAHSCYDIGHVGAIVAIPEHGLFCSIDKDDGRHESYFIDLKLLSIPKNIKIL